MRQQSKGYKPVPVSESVSMQMKRMPRSNTKPELNLRKAFHHLGLRYRTNFKELPGTPDVVFTRVKMAVFVDGCFWHMCPEHGVIPKSNRKWWKPKLEANVERDARKDVELKSMGWLPVHIWEHEDPVVAANTIRELWLKRQKHR